MDVRQVDWLTDYNYLGEKILAPALTYAKGRQLITAQESSVLQVVAKRGVVKAAELATAMPEMSPAQRTYLIKKLVESKMLQAIKEGARQYTIVLSYNTLIRGIIQA